MHKLLVGLLAIVAISFAAVDNAHAQVAIFKGKLAGSLIKVGTSGEAVVAVANTDYVTPTGATFIAVGADPADAGAIRLANAAVIGWEADVAGTDVTLGVNSSEQFVFSAAILSPTFVTPTLGAASATSVAATGGVTSSGSTGAGIGYATGAGGAVTQATNRTTTAVLSKLAGQITTDAASMAAQTPTTFTVTNTTVAATDVVVISKVSGDVDTFAWVNSVGAGSYTVTLFNSAAAEADTTAFVFNYAVIKSVAQ